MHDLRKKVLVQSGKTQSRKARAREDPRPKSSDPTDSNKSPGSSPRASPNSSRAGSRTNSRPGSRYASENESDSDEFFGTVDSESGFDSDDDDLEDREWMARLRMRMTQLQDYRKTSASERELTNTSYLHLIRNYFARDQIDGCVNGTIFPALLNSIERGASEKEVLTALNALSVTLISSPSETVFERAFKALKVVCEESEHEKVKVAAMNALAIALAFEGGMQPDIEEVLDFLLDIVESDGQSVGAEDNGAVVSGALRAWGCAASYLEDLAETTEDGRAMDAFMEQLDSTDADVQIAAGYNIAHLFEAARNSSGADLQHNQHIALTRMHEIVKYWTKRTSKKDRRALRDEFPGIIISIEKGVGPGYAENGRLVVTKELEAPANKHAAYLDDMSHLGLQRKERVLEGGSRIIDSWKCHARLEVLKQVLVGGMDLHWRVNPAVQAALWRPTRRNVDSQER